MDLEWDLTPLRISIIMICFQRKETGNDEMVMEYFMEKIPPDGDPMYEHRDEGPDDMSAHVRTVLTDSSLMVPINNGTTLLGTWQGIYLWEHRTHPHLRRITVTGYGD